MIVDPNMLGFATKRERARESLDPGAERDLIRTAAETRMALIFISRRPAVVPAACHTA